MRTIAIVLGDNDFGHTFRPLLEGLKLILSYRESESLTESDVETIIRSNIAGYYAGYQRRFDLTQKDNSPQYLERIKVLFDEAAEEDIAAKDHDGGAWYLEVQSGVVSSY